MGSYHSIDAMFTKPNPSVLPPKKLATNYVVMFIKARSENNAHLSMGFSLCMHFRYITHRLNYRRRTAVTVASQSRARPSDRKR